MMERNIFSSDVAFTPTVVAAPRPEIGETECPDQLMLPL